MSTPNPGWKRVKFADLAECVNERVDDPSQAGVDRYVGLEHLDPESLSIRRWGTPDDVESTKLRFRPGDIIFGKRRAYQRKLAVAAFEGICSAHAMVLRAKPHSQSVLPDFLPFFMQSDVFMDRAKAISVGSLSPTINWKTLAAEEFALPPLEEQGRIVSVLRQAHVTRELTREAARAAQTVARSYVEDTLTALKQRYPLAPAVGLLSRLTVGIVVKPADWYTDDLSGVPALRSLNVRPGELVMEDVVRITAAGHQAHEKSVLRDGDVVVVRTGRPGEAAVIPSGIGPLNCIDLIVTTPGEGLYAHYFALVLNSQFGKRLFSAGATGTAQQHFNVGAFKRLELPLPPLRVQQTVAETAVSLRQCAERLDSRATEDGSLYDRLLQQLGEA